MPEATRGSQFVPPMERYLPAQAYDGTLASIELKSERSISDRLGIKLELYWELDCLVSSGRPGIHGGPRQLPDGITPAEARRLHPIACAAIEYVNDLVWNQRKPVLLGAFKAELERLRLQYGNFTQPPLDIEA